MDQSKPLEGIKVVDFSQLIAGPSAGAMLADLGASVVKVERPDGELARWIGAVDGIVPTFVAYNRDKRAVSIDMRDAEGLAVIKRLVREADVVIEGFRPGVMARLGLDAAGSLAINPRLVYMSLTAFQADDPRPGVDAVIQAASGIMSITGDPDGPPLKVGFQMTDAATGLAISQAVLAALFKRERTGEGCHLQTSLYEVATYAQSPAFVQASLSGLPVARQGNTAGQMGYPTDLFATADGGYFMIAAYFPDQFVLLCETLGCADLLSDPRFATNEARIENHRTLRPILAGIFAERTRDEWEVLLGRAGVISSAVRTHDEILARPDLRKLGSFEAVVDDHGLERWIPRLPYSSSTWTTKPEWRYPKIGEDTLEVLAELGMSVQEIEALGARGVVSIPESVPVVVT